jgi:hypothetical protein
MCQVKGSGKIAPAATSTHSKQRVEVILGRNRLEDPRNGFVEKPRESLLAIDITNRLEGAEKFPADQSTPVDQPTVGNPWMAHDFPSIAMAHSCR